MNTPYTAPDAGDFETADDRAFALIMAANQSESKPEPARCYECNRPSDNPEGICYECQCLYHQMGGFDMDGRGWR